jgi:hypothetical protein
MQILAFSERFLSLHNNNADEEAPCAHIIYAQGRACCLNLNVFSHTAHATNRLKKPYNNCYYQQFSANVKRWFKKICKISMICARGISHLPLKLRGISKTLVAYLEALRTHLL